MFGQGNSENARALETPAAEVLQNIERGTRSLGLHVSSLYADVETLKSENEELKNRVEALEFQMKALLEKIEKEKEEE